MTLINDYQKPNTIPTAEISVSSDPLQGVFDQHNEKTNKNVHHKKTQDKPPQKLETRVFSQTKPRDEDFPPGKVRKQEDPKPSPQFVIPPKQGTQTRE